MGARSPATRYVRLAATLIVLGALAGCHTAKVLIPPNLRPAEDNTAARKQAIEQLQ